MGAEPMTCALLGAGGMLGYCSVVTALPQQLGGSFPYPEIAWYYLSLINLILVWCS